MPRSEAARKLASRRARVLVSVTRDVATLIDRLDEVERRFARLARRVRDLETAEAADAARAYVERVCARGRSA